ncbi:hypothetical protein HZB02_06750 [Candidatus Woesearchaeota archaeon]|nr:hypothetical protein [Candidatus Woesearchaeota archaeon]
MPDSTPTQTSESKLADKIKPLVEQLTHKFIGVNIDELNKDLSSKIDDPLAGVIIDPTISFKKAKQQFKRTFLRKVLQKHYGNISEAAREAEVNRRSIHRLLREMKSDVHKMRRDMAQPYMIKKEELNTLLEDVLGSYTKIIHPEKMKDVYASVPIMSDELLKLIPDEIMPLKDAEHEFERRYLKKALELHNFNPTKTARAIGLRYETLHRKIKALGIEK